MQFYTDYLMVISPPDHIKKEITRYKRASVNLIGHFEGMHSTAHITITHQTRCKPFLVQPAILKMGIRLKTINPVELQITGFNFFSHGQTAKTIYAEIEITPHSENWFKLLQREMGIKVKNFVPHMAIAKNIPVTAFKKLWPNFENREFSETFKPDSLTILHRETFVEYCEWRVYKELFFANKLKEMF
ncbi:MAG TPA: 2'-5' RNA ligase family protein [Mucilaginibacter sp.]|jgi:2'-5' RNA ligase